ncbi:unnamed protein product [Amaranthus hypochondriacus]
MVNNNSSNGQSSTDPTMNPGSVYYLHPSDSSQKLINITFSSTGFVDWKRVMIIALSGKNKLGFVDGSLPKPSQNSTRRAWERVNNVVMGWIIGVLEESIAKSVLSYKTTKDIWYELNERYGQSSNAQLYSLQEELNNLVQTPKMKIAEFFTKIKTIWDELDSLNPIPLCSCAVATSCTCEIAKKCYKVQQNNRVISFLMRLDKKYSQVRTNMLMMAELPTSAQAYRILQQEETHLGLSVMDTNDTLACSVEKRKFQERNTGRNGVDNNKAKKQHFYCDLCKINGHNKEKCWKVVAYPTNYKNNSWRRNGDRSNANIVQESSREDGFITGNFTTTQYQQLLDLLDKQGNQPANNSTQLVGLT